MSYISIKFFVFLICLFGVYFLTPDRHKWKTLLLFSILFYLSNGLDKFVFIIATSLVVYGASRRMDAIYQDFDAACQEQEFTSKEKKTLGQVYIKRSKRILSLVLFVCLGILCYCKFGLKALGLVNHIAGTSFYMSVIVPLGVSYYTFSAIAYLLDIHWRKIRAEKNYFRLLLCMIYFPHIVEGPISRYEKLLPQFDKLKRPDYEQLCMGLQLMLWGFFKKLVIADRLAIFTNSVFGNIETNTGLIFPIALILAAFQMYTDFSGCMDIVTGISDIIGIKLAKNFDHPFFSRSAAEFWRRWHITLGEWFKDYVYMPVTTSALTRTLRRTANKFFGANGAKLVMTILPSWTVWLLTGIWHGTGKNYICWGLYWGVIIAFSNLFEETYQKLAHKLNIDRSSRNWGLVQMLRTFSLYVIGLLPISAHGVRNAFEVVKRTVFLLDPWIFWDYSLYNYGLDRRNFILAILSIVFLLYIETLQEHMNLRQAIAQKPLVVRWSIYFIGIFAVLIFGIYGPGYDASAFVYSGF